MAPLISPDGRSTIEPFGRSGSWNIRYVKDILKSRAPLGHLDTKHGLIEDTFPRIVDDDLWLLVQAACKARTGKGGHKLNAAVNLFAGIGRCADCEGNMRINRHGRTGHRYYECTNHAVLRICPNRHRYRVDMVEEVLLQDLGWLTIPSSERQTPADLAVLTEQVTTYKARYKRLASKLQELDDDEMYEEIERQLRELRAKINDASTQVAAVQRAIAVAAAPVRIGDISDRPRLHTALQRLIKGVYFGENHEVAIVSNAGLLLMINVRPPLPGRYLEMLSPDGKLLVIDNGAVRITEAPPIMVAGLRPLDAKTIADIQAHLAISDSEPKVALPQRSLPASNVPPGS